MRSKHTWGEIIPQNISANQIIILHVGLQVIMDQSVAWRAKV